MGINKNLKGFYDAQFYYKDSQGNKVKKHKRNFKTKKEAQGWMYEYMAKQSYSLDMTFKSLWELYRDDMSQKLRENTIRTKNYIVDLKM